MKILLILFLASSLLQSFSTSAPTSSSSSSQSSQLGTTLRWFAPFYSGGGYCSEAFAIVSSLHEIPNRNFSLEIVHHGDSFNNDFLVGLSKSEEEFLYKLDANFDPHALAGRGMSKKKKGKEIVVCHSEPGAWHAPYPNYHTTRCPPSTADYKIGRTMFETDTLPSGWANRLNTMDEIWVPTEFAKNIFLQGGVDIDKLIVVGEPVDTQFYSPQDVSFLTPPPGDASTYSEVEMGSSGDNAMIVSDRAELEELAQVKAKGFTLFLFVGKWEQRKGVKLLLQAYLEEFSHEEKVALVILTNAYHSTSDFAGEIDKFLEEEEQGRHIADLKSHLPSYRVLSKLPQRLMPHLYSLASVLVIPSHGEGWGRPHVESMSCGVPVIATNWSGPTKFINEDNGYPLTILPQLVPTPGWEGHRWAQPNVTHLRELLRRVHTFPEEVKLKGQRARQDIVEKYSLEAMGVVFSQQIQRVHEKMNLKKKKKK